MIGRSIFLVTVLAVLALVGCARDPAEAAQPGATDASDPAAVAQSGAASASAARQQPASEAMPAQAAFEGFRVEVTLSPAAREKLAKDKETIIVSADYFGTPVAAAVDQADQVGQLDLGKAQRELAQAGGVDFDQTGFLGARLNLVEGPPQVNINVYSGRHSSPDNLLDCDFFQDALSVAAKAPIRLSCKLIGEP